MCSFIAILMLEHLVVRCGLVLKSCYNYDSLSSCSCFYDPVSFMIMNGI